MLLLQILAPKCFQCDCILPGVICSPLVYNLQKDWTWHILKDAKKWGEHAASCVPAVQEVRSSCPPSPQGILWLELFISISLLSMR